MCHFLLRISIPMIIHGIQKNYPLHLNLRDNYGCILPFLKRAFALPSGGWTENYFHGYWWNLSRCNGLKLMGTSHVAQVAPLPRSPLNDISAPPPVADSDQPHQSPCRCGAGAFIAPYPSPSVPHSFSPYVRAFSSIKKILFILPRKKMLNISFLQ